MLYIIISNSDWIFQTPSTEAKMATIRGSFRNACAPGDDDISPFPTERSTGSIVGPLAHRFNQLLVTGVFRIR